MILAKKNAALFSKKIKIKSLSQFVFEIEMYRTGYVAFQNPLFDP